MSRRILKINPYFELTLKNQMLHYEFEPIKAFVLSSTIMIDIEQKELHSKIKNEKVTYLLTTVKRLSFKSYRN